MTKLSPVPQPPYSAAEVARMLGMAPAVVRAAIECGQLPGYRVGRNFAVPREAFERWRRVAGPRTGRLREATEGVVTTGLTFPCTVADCGETVTVAASTAASAWFDPAFALCDAHAADAMEAALAEYDADLDLDLLGAPR